MDSRVSKLANIVDDKTIIAQLIREKSDRVRLIEFKDARADIWQFFRLVCLDGVTLPYAVCVRCMKPVSYKAREGTGGLHRHPCSKQAIAAAIAAGIPFNTSNNRSAKVNTTSVSKAIASIPSSSSQTFSNPNKINTNSKLNFQFNSFAAIEMVNNFAKNRNLGQELIGPNFSHHLFDSQQLHNSLIQDFTEENSVYNEEMLSSNILKLFCSELIPLEILENGIFIKLFQQLINFGATNGPIGLEPIQVNSLVCNTYETSRIDFKQELKKQSFITFIIDLWEQEITKRQFMTVWAQFGNTERNENCKIITTKDISAVDNCEDLMKELDFIKHELIGFDSDFIYLFDNSYDKFGIKESDNLLFCVNHQLNQIMNQMFNNREFCHMFSEVKTISTLIEGFDNLSFISQMIPNFNNWSQILKLFKIINESNLNEIIAEHEFKFVESEYFNEIIEFFSLFTEALNSFCCETDKSITTINLVTLWRVKLENHCKITENDSNFLKNIKEILKEAIIKSNLNHSIFLMAVCFDPRFKKLKMLSKELRDKTYEVIRKLINKFSIIKQELQDSNSSDFSPMVSFDAKNNDNQRLNKKVKISEDKATQPFNEYLDEVNEQEKDELERYLNLDVGQTQPLEFWCGEYANRFPKMRSLANRILSIPAVPSKCCQYSTAGELLSIRRKSLDSRYLDKVLVLHSHFTSN